MNLPLWRIGWQCTELQCQASLPMDCQPDDEPVIRKQIMQQICTGEGTEYYANEGGSVRLCNPQKKKSLTPKQIRPLIINKIENLVIQWGPQCKPS